MTAPLVAIVVVNYNGADFLEEFATSLHATTYPNKRLFLIDNASSDGSRDHLRAHFPSAEILLNHRNLGLAPALNQALERCLDDETRYVMFLNPDTTHDPSFIDRLVASADDRTIVVPKVLSYFDHNRINTHAGGFDWTRGIFIRTFDGALDGPDTSTRHEVETASFCAMLIPAEAFRDAGRLDERLAMYYEDTDFVARARAAGYRAVFEPASVIYHREGGSSGGKESPFKHYYATRNRPYIVRKHVSLPRYLAFTAYFLATRAVHVVAYAAHRQWPLALAQLRAVRDFYTGRMGMTYTPADLLARSKSPLPWRRRRLV